MQATKLARSMVCEWGMSEKLGPLAYGEPDGEVFLGHSVAQRKNVSDETARAVDAEMKLLVDNAYNKAKQILTDKKGDLEKLAEAMIEYETLTGDEISYNFV